MKKVHYWILATALLTFPNETNAQSRHEQVKTQVDSVLTARYYKTPYDTNYVVRPEGRLTLKMRVNQSGDNFHVKGDKDGVISKADLCTSFKTTVSIGASYRGISTSLAINPAKMKGAYKDYEFNLAYYSSRLSLDASYHRSTSLAGDTDGGNATGQQGQVPVSMK